MPASVALGVISVTLVYEPYVSIESIVKPVPFTPVARPYTFILSDVFAAMLPDM